MCCNLNHTQNWSEAEEKLQSIAAYYFWVWHADTELWSLSGIMFSVEKVQIICLYVIDLFITLFLLPCIVDLVIKWFRILIFPLYKPHTLTQHKQK